MNGGLRGKVVVVTGASAGVGRATAREFARAGAHVGLVARNHDALESVRHEIEAAGTRALILPLDVADGAAVANAARKVEESLGPIDVWVNSAMTTVVAPIHDLDVEEFRRVTEVTYLGAVHGTLAAIQYMLTRNRGVIVQVGSTLAYRSIPLQAPYCAAKAAIRGFTDSLRTELAHAHSGVRVTMVHLPAVNTPQFDWCRTHMPRQPRPVAPVYQPEVAARAIVWAATHRRRELFVGSRTYPGVWLNRRAPKLLDQYLGRTGFESQMRPEPVAADRRDNLFETVPGHHATHGSFDSEAKSASGALWLTTHRGAVAALGAGLLGLACLAAGIRSGSVRRWLS